MEPCGTPDSILENSVSSCSFLMMISRYACPSNAGCSADVRSGTIGHRRL